MASPDVDRDRLRDARQKLEEWIAVAREDAYEDVFEGSEAEVDEADLRTLDRLDSELSRNGDGIWGTDTYGVVAGGTREGASRPRVVCTYHPQIPEAEPFARNVDDATTDRLNDALWTYCERVAEHAQAALADDVSDGDPPT